MRGPRKTWRTAALGLLIGLLACAPAAAQETEAYRRAVEARFDAWVEALWHEARARGISRATFEQARRVMRLDWSLPDLDLPLLGPGEPARPHEEHLERQRPQAEFGIPANYFPEAGLNRFVARGRALMAQWRDTLARIERRFGVEAQVVMAVWARETGYGAARLPHNALSALATQAFMGRRKRQFQDELLLALAIVEAGNIEPQAMASSWAGAMGQTQFMPSDFMKYAIDFDGDGRRDIWRSIPDALASTANSLKSNGWQTGKTWAYEVHLPQGFDCTLQGPWQARAVAEWVGLGVARTRGRSFARHQLADPAFLVLPAGLRGPAFLALDNFLVLKSYNFADLYAIYVGHLADRLIDNRPFATPWGEVSRFRRDEVLALQQMMLAQGIDVGKMDGLIGAKVRASVGALQRRLGLPMDCYPSRDLLVRAAAATPPPRPLRRP